MSVIEEPVQPAHEVFGGGNRSHEDEPEDLNTPRRVVHFKGCRCGWTSPEFETEDEAIAAAEAHVANPA